jgi:hypothetical protein
VRSRSAVVAVCAAALPSPSLSLSHCAIGLCACCSCASGHYSCHQVVRSHPHLWHGRSSLDHLAPHRPAGLTELLSVACHLAHVACPLVLSALCL